MEDIPGQSSQEQAQPASSLLDTLPGVEPVEQQAKRPRVDAQEPPLEKPNSTKDLPKWGDDFYGMLNAHDMPDENPESDLLTEEELPPEARRCPKHVRRLIRNCHRNLGHPSNFALVRLMTIAKCHPDMIAYAQHMK